MIDEVQIDLLRGEIEAVERDGLLLDVVERARGMGRDACARLVGVGDEEVWVEAEGEGQELGARVLKVDVEAKARPDCCRVEGGAAARGASVTATERVSQGRSRAKPCCFIEPERPARAKWSPVSRPGDGKSTGIPPRTFFAGSRIVASSR